MSEALTIREQIAAAVMSRLTAALAPVPVERNRRDAPDEKDAPLVIVYDGDHVASPGSQVDSRYQMQIGIEAAVTAPNDAALGPARNALYGKIITALMADYTLGGLCIELREQGMTGRIVPAEEASIPLAEFAVEITADFMTLDGNPYTF